MLYRSIVQENRKMYIFVKFCYYICNRDKLYNGFNIYRYVHLVT